MESTVRDRPIIQVPTIIKHMENKGRIALNINHISILYLTTLDYNFKLEKNF
jgi:hypothetical protein